MAGSGTRLNPAEHLVRNDGAFLGYLSPRAVLKCFDRPKVPTTTPYSGLMHARTIINVAVPLKHAATNLKWILLTSIHIHVGESPFYRRILVFTAQLTSTTRANMCIVISYFVKLALTIQSLSGQPTTSRYRQHSKRRWSARHYFCLSCIFRLGLLFKNFTRFKNFSVFYIVLVFYRIPCGALISL